MPAKGYKKDKPELKCEHCPYTTLRQCFMRDHERIHTGERPFSCEICGKGFTQKSNLKQHLKVHGTGYSDSFKCDQCDFVTKWKTSLQAHKRWHNGEKPFKCEICGRTFSQMTHCKTHQKESHFNVRHFQCDICSKTFKRQDHLDRHQLFHANERNYECDICHKKFIEERYVIIHKRIHLGESSKCFKCDRCPYKTRYKQGLDIHYRTHTGVRPYKCKDCGRSFVTSQSLRLHTRMVHQGMAGKIFKCSTCDFSTANKQSLKNHTRRIHLGIKDAQDLKCDYCDVRYKFRCSLVKHKKKLHAAEFAADKAKRPKAVRSEVTANIIGSVVQHPTETVEIKTEPEDGGFSDKMVYHDPERADMRVKGDTEEGEEQMALSCIQVVNQPEHIMNVDEPESEAGINADQPLTTNNEMNMKCSTTRKRKLRQVRDEIFIDGHTKEQTPVHTRYKAKSAVRNNNQTKRAVAETRNKSGKRNSRSLDVPSLVTGTTEDDSTSKATRKSPRKRNSQPPSRLIEEDSSPAAKKFEPLKKKLQTKPRKNSMSPRKELKKFSPSKRRRKVEIIVQYEDYDSAEAEDDLEQVAELKVTDVRTDHETAWDDVETSLASSSIQDDCTASSDNTWHIEENTMDVNAGQDEMNGLHTRIKSEPCD